MDEILREVAAAVREQSYCCIAPVQAAFMALATRLDERAAALAVVPEEITETPISISEDVQIVADDEPDEPAEDFE